MREGAAVTICYNYTGTIGERAGHMYIGQSRSMTMEVQMYTMHGWYGQCPYPEVIDVDSWDDVLMMVDWWQLDMYHTVIVTRGRFERTKTVLAFSQFNAPR